MTCCKKLKRYSIAETDIAIVACATCFEEAKYEIMAWTPKLRVEFLKQMDRALYDFNFDDFAALSFDKQENFLDNFLLYLAYELAVGGSYVESEVYGI